MHISTTIHKSISQKKASKVEKKEALPSLEFWYEFASPYSYLSAIRIEELAQKHSFEIIWKPFLLGPIFKDQGLTDSPFNIFKTKGDYMWKDMERLSVKRQIPFNKPKVFPQNGLLAARIAILGSDHPWIGEFTKEVFRANFVKQEDISSSEIITKILNKLNLDAEKIISEAHQDENKEKLKLQTKQAQDSKIFGAPTFKINDDIFWGDDRLDLTIEYLKKS